MATIKPYPKGTVFRWTGRKPYHDPAGRFIALPNDLVDLPKDEAFPEGFVPVAPPEPRAPKSRG